ncbi:MAG: hypothetical protein ACYTFV_04165 [Planctomycetota bacterium]|jgi:hypothetical protein
MSDWNRGRSDGVEAPEVDQQDLEATRDEESSAGGTTRLTERVHIRLSPSEREAVEFLAGQAGLSIGRFLMEAVRRDFDRQSDQARSHATKLLARSRRRPRKKVGASAHEDRVGRFKCPFLQREHAAPLEACVRESARRMGVSELSSARHLTYFFESLAKRVAAGEAVRIPGFGVFGPWHSENSKGVDGCLPRFVASAPFRDYVQYETHPRDAQNGTLRAHSRRRRSRGSSVVDAMATIRLHLGSQNREAQRAFERWIELGL